MCLFFIFLIRSADGDDEEEVVHMGNAIMSFYSALIDLLGRCAPEMHVCLTKSVNCFEVYLRYVSLFSFPLYLLCSSSTRGKVKLYVSVPSCALWCQQKTLWELLAYLSKCPSLTKVRRFTLFRNSISYKSLYFIYMLL